MPVAAVVFAALATSQSTIAMPPVAVRSAAAVAFVGQAPAQKANVARGAVLERPAAAARRERVDLVK